VFLNELDTCVDVPQITFLHEVVGPLHVWSYAGVNREGEVLFSGFGGDAFFVKNPYGTRGHRPKGAHALDGLNKMLAEATPYGKADIYINNFSLRKSFAEVMSGNDNINILASHPVEAHKVATQLLEAHGRKVAHSVVLTTDASVPTDGKSMGAGWIMAYGSPLSIYCDAKHIPSTHGTYDSLIGELMAIREGINDVLRRVTSLKRGWGTITIRSDSAHAIHLLESMIAGEDKLIAHANHWVVAKTIIRNIGAANVRFEWVRGHDGNEMNEFADRLAKSAYRNASYGTDSIVVAEMVNSIRDEAVNALRHRTIYNVAKARVKE
jgi:ribonuclease HI